MLYHYHYLKTGRLAGISCQHSTMKAYILDGQSSGHGNNWRDRIISITWIIDIINIIYGK